MKKRHILGYTLSLIPHSLRYNCRRLFQGPYLTVLCYHRIMDTPPDFPFDSDLVSASLNQFEQQLSYVSKKYEVINFRILHHYIKQGDFPPKALIITFDDGYEDNYLNAYPLLKKFDLTATMFVTAGFINKNRLFWWDKIAYLIKKSGRHSLEIEDPVNLSLKFDHYSGRQECAGKVIKRAKKLPEEAKERLIQRIQEQLEVNLPGEETGYTMKWDHLKEMSDNGIEIGAHSINHPIFSNVDESRLRKEVAAPKKMIEEKIGCEVITFGSPGRGIMTPGQRKEFERLLTVTIRESGYHFSTMYKWGLALGKSFDPYSVERIGIETHDSINIFKSKLSFPEVITY